MNQCPRCSYTLEGLPENHVCPECGLVYHGETIYFRLARSRFTWSQYAFVLAVSSLVILEIDLLDEPFRVPAMWLWVLIVPVLGAMSVVWSKNDPGGEFVVDRIGVRLRRPRLGTETIEMADIGRAKCSKWTGNLILLGENGQKLRSIPCAYLGGLKSVEACAKLINDAIQSSDSNAYGRDAAAN